MGEEKTSNRISPTVVVTRGRTGCQPIDTDWQICFGSAWKSQGRAYSNAARHRHP